MAATVDPAGPADEPGVACAHCGSPQIRRSAPKGLLEYIVRSASPVHYYRCRACGRRGYHWGRIPRARGAGGRPIESRDVRLRRRRKVRLAITALLAIALGIASGLYVHSCEESAEAAKTNAPSP